ncbi:MAG: PQQ-binding-like beta-propeller repeat protein [Ilumatobacteraceae bacterium]
MTRPSTLSYGLLLTLLIVSACGADTSQDASGSTVANDKSFPSANNCNSGAEETAKENSELLSFSLGDLTFTTVSPLVSRFEDALKVVVEVTNSGSAEAIVDLNGVELGWAAPPEDPQRRWYSQLFDLNPAVQTVAPGGTATYSWHLDMDGDLEQRNEYPRFSPRFSSDGSTVSLDIDIVSGEIYGDPKSLGLALDSTILGTVLDEAGNPLSGVEVEALLFSFKERLGSAQTNEQGEFALCVPSLDSYTERLGNRASGYALSTHLRVRDSAGSYGFTSVSPKRGEVSDVTITVARANSAALELVGETRYDTRHGFFWVQPLGSGFVTTEGQHPPELRQPGSVVAFALDGSERWSTATGDECWGFDVSSTGLVAAGCHDGYVSVWNSDGELLWERKTQKSESLYARLVKFSRDGSSLLAGPLDDDVELLDSATGETIWGYSANPSDVRPRPEILRNAVFSDDDRRVVVGYSGGYLTSLETATGLPEWAGGFIGEFPLTLDIDSEGNIYAVGKGREAISIDPTGEVRWRTQVYEHVSTAGISALVDGKFISHTVSGSVYALDAASGEFLWWRKIGQGDMVDGYVETGGHNALDIDPTTGFIAHTETLDSRDGGGSVVTLMNSNGAVLASQHFPDAREQEGQEVGHAQRGAMAVSFNGKGQLTVVFGDGTVRVFQVK